MTIDDSTVLEQVDRIALPTRLGVHLAEQLWGSGATYRVDPWLQHVEQSVVPAVLDRTVETFRMVNLPPQVGKTSFSGQLLPFWILGLFPDLRIIFVAYSDDYARMRGKVVRDMMKTFGSSLFGHTVDPTNDSGGDWTIAGHLGGMLSVGIGSQITGRSGDVIIIDDVIKNAEEAASVATKRKHMLEYDGTIRPRLQPGGTIIITATRWAEDDISGTLQDRQSAPDYAGDVYEVTSIPAIAEPEDDDEEIDDTWRDELGRQLGEPLQCRFTRPDEPFETNHFYRLRNSIDVFSFNALYQGRPSVREGGMFPKPKWAWFDPGEHPYIIERMRVWDLAATEGGGDFTVGSLVGKDVDGNFYVLDVVRVQRSADAVRALIHATARNDGFMTKIRIEEARDGAGKSVVEFYKVDPALKGYDVDKVKAEGSKESRAMPYSSLQQAGHVHLPSGADWTKKFIDEHKQMMGDGRRPRHDDQIDTVAYAVLEMADSGPVTIVDQRSYLPQSNQAMKEMAMRLGYRIAG